MKTILLFNKERWNKAEVTEFLEDKNINHKLRYGFSHILSISDEEIDCSGFVNDKDILCIYFDKKSNTASENAVIINEHGGKIVNLNKLLNNGNNIQFDLSNFGFVPNSNSQIEELYKIIRNTQLSSKVDMLGDSKCENIFTNTKVPNDIKKIILDIFTLRSVAMAIIVNFQQKKLLYQYAQTFLLAFTTRAQIEKLMLLFAKIDDNLNFQILDKSKKMKSTFKKQAENTKIDLTKKFSLFLEDVDLLDENYRTPETHKMGRLLGLIYNEHSGTILNEIISFQNKSNQIFNKVCEFIKEKYGSSNNYVGK